MDHYGEKIYYTVARKRRVAPGWGKQGKYETDPSTGEQLYRDGSGMLYEWDKEKKAWFPRIDDDFMAQYQMNYGFTKDGVAEPTRPDEPKPEEADGEPMAKKAKGVAEPAKAKWFEEDEAKTTKVSRELFPLLEKLDLEFVSAESLGECKIGTGLNFEKLISLS